MSEFNSSYVNIIKDQEAGKDHLHLKDFIEKKNSKSVLNRPDQYVQTAEDVKEEDNAGNENAEVDKKADSKTKENKQPPGTSIIDDLIENDIKQY